MISFLAFSQGTGKIFPKSSRIIDFYAERSFLRFDEESVLEMTPHFYFKIDDKPKKINKKNYFKLYFGEDSTKDCFGYVRKVGHKILIVPTDTFITSGKEFTLFNFDSKIGVPWKIPELGIFCDNQMRIDRKYYSNRYKENLYLIFITSYSAKTCIKYLIVGENVGIVKVIFHYEYGFTKECRNKK